jgi:small subunit ribosomal protein S17
MSDETVNSVATPAETEPAAADAAEPTPAEQEMASLASEPAPAETPAPEQTPDEAESPVVAESSAPASDAAPSAPGTESAAASQPAATPVRMPDPTRGRRKVRIGKVASSKMDKTVVVVIESKVRHPLYGKIIRRTTRFKVHDEHGTCGDGDTVEIMETRPISKEKRWRVVRIIQKAK